VNCGSYHPKFEVIFLELGSSALQVGAVYLFRAPSLDALQASPLYYLQAVRSHKNGSPPMEMEYKNCVGVYADALAQALEESSFDGVVQVPSSRPFLQEPYRDAILRSHPKARDFTHLLHGTFSGASTFEERYRALELDALPASGLRMVVLDDVLSTQASIRAVAMKFREVDATISLKLVFPLWIPPDMKNPMARWIEAAKRVLENQDDSPF
jgi:hypothetical protein